MQDTHDRLKFTPWWVIRKYESDEARLRGDEPYETRVIEGNLALTEGITEVANLIAGLGTPTAFDNANAYLGVGSDNTAADASQTDLQASSNKTYMPMESGYPQLSGQTLTWRAIFGSADANYAWEEFTVANGSSGSAVNLNRRVTSQGTKASGQSWTLDLNITIG